jgi:hypothetical protein
MREAAAIYSILLPAEHGSAALSLYQVKIHESLAFI